MLLINIKIVYTTLKRVLLLGRKSEVLWLYFKFWNLTEINDKTFSNLILNYYQ